MPLLTLLLPSPYGGTFNETNVLLNVTTPPTPFPAPGAWVEDAEGVTLVGGRCTACGKVAFPQRSICDRCGGAGDQEPTPLPQSGTLYTYSEVHVAPEGFDVPFVVGYVDFEPDVRVLAQIEGSAAELAVGDEVEATVGIIRTFPDGRSLSSYRFRKRDRA
jgi:uncharacterized OB-fold protein